MREIKFRAWQDDQMLTQPMSGNYATARFFGFLYEDAPVMQYTGLKDKNGKEIYEGDIVQHQNGWTGVIVWNQEDCAFISENLLDRKDTAWLASDIQTVIGNIYESPELISGACEVE